MEAEAVTDAGDGRDLQLDGADLGPEGRVGLAAVPAERPTGEDLHHLGDLFLADEFYAGSGHAGLPPSAGCATDCMAP